MSVHVFTADGCSILRSEFAACLQCWKFFEIRDHTKRGGDGAMLGVLRRLKEPREPLRISYDR